MWQSIMVTTVRQVNRIAYDVIKADCCIVVSTASHHEIICSKEVVTLHVPNAKLK